MQKSERSIHFKDFRNLGVSEKGTKLTINHYFGEKAGELTILVGSNNGGKSNVLEGIKKLSSAEIEKKDINTNKGIDIDSNIGLPEIELFTNIEGQKNRDVLKYEVGSEAFKDNKIKEQAALKFSRFKNALADLCSEDIKKWIYNNWTGNIKFVTRLDSYRYSLDWNAFGKAMVDELKIFVEWIYTRGKNSFNSTYVQKLEKFFNKEEVKCIREMDESFYDDEFVEAYLQSTKLEYKNKIALTRSENLQNLKVIDFDSIPLINGSDLNNEFKSKIKLDGFFDKLLQNLNFDTDEVISAIQESISEGYAGRLKEYSKSINKKLENISNQFNKVFNFSEDKYEFNIDINKSNIEFLISNNGMVVKYSQQSVGFKWFFNLYFNFIINGSFKSGDIIVMDEVGSKLHAKGITELANFLRSFAQQNNVNFVVATHSPFMINMDYLEELRIIENDEKNNASIVDNFTVGGKEKDVIGNIADALTIEQFVITNPKNIVIFVEGITDYEYLTKFKQLYKNLFEHEITFLPIQGVKTKNQTELREMIEKLGDIRLKPFFLVDGDDAGSKFIEETKDLNCEVKTLSNIDSKFKVIEDLFDGEDKVKFSSEKGFNGAIEFKRTVDFDDISEKTKANFKKVFEWIKENYN